MQRDMELVREILLALERHPHGFAPDNLGIKDYSEEQVAYHAYIMGQAGLIEVADSTNLGSSGPEALLKNMTWEGHEFLDAAREPQRWAEAKTLLHKAGGASFKVWTVVLTELVKRGLGI
ncbi:MAG: DUF2513 domain-containing protein [Betaproteobacteria bacterium]|nr:DUF2513 domain-containing protein [Betaproteobacteria bacterium]